MPIVRIDSIGDSRLDDYRDVSDAELLRTRGLFVAEGRLVVRRLFASGYEVVSLLLNDPSLRALEPDVRIHCDGVPVYVCPTAELTEIIGFNLHRGCLALARRPAERPVADLTANARLLLVLEQVTDADNVGSAFRNAAAFSADGVLLGACCDPFYRKAVRTSMGSVLTMPFARTRLLSGDLAAMRAAGFTIVALTPDPSASSLYDFAMQTVMPVKIALLVGSEANGLQSDTLSAADVRVRIPQRPEIDSLNLATASGIALSVLTRRDWTSC